jgi:hypothetical protein
MEMAKQNYLGNGSCCAISENENKQKYLRLAFLGNRELVQCNIDK